MSAALRQIERDALASPAKERARLMDRLWESLGDTSYPILGDKWEKEIERRRGEVMAGKVKPVPGEEVSRRTRELVKATRS